MAQDYLARNKLNDLLKFIDKNKYSPDLIQLIEEYKIANEFGNAMINPRFNIDVKYTIPLLKTGLINIQSDDLLENIIKNEDIQLLKELIENGYLNLNELDEFHKRLILKYMITNTGYFRGNSRRINTQFLIYLINRDFNLHGTNINLSDLLFSHFSETINNSYVDGNPPYIDQQTFLDELFFISNFNLDLLFKIGLKFDVNPEYINDLFNTFINYHLVIIDANGTNSGINKRNKRELKNSVFEKLKQIKLMHDNIIKINLDPYLDEFLFNDEIQEDGIKSIINSYVYGKRFDNEKIIHDHILDKLVELYSFAIKVKMDYDAAVFPTVVMLEQLIGEYEFLSPEGRLEIQENILRELKDYLIRVMNYYYNAYILELEESVGEDINLQHQLQNRVLLQQKIDTLNRINQNKTNYFEKWFNSEIDLD